MNEELNWIIITIVINRNVLIAAGFLLFVENVIRVTTLLLTTMLYHVIRILIPPVMHSTNEFCTK